jgi:hypothetical protein
LLAISRAFSAFSLFPSEFVAAFFKIQLRTFPQFSNMALQKKRTKKMQLEGIFTCALKVSASIAAFLRLRKTDPQKKKSQELRMFFSFFFFHKIAVNEMRNVKSTETGRRWQGTSLSVHTQFFIILLILNLLSLSEMSKYVHENKLLLSKKKMLFLISCKQNWSFSPIPRFFSSFFPTFEKKCAVLSLRAGIPESKATAQMAK